MDEHSIVGACNDIDGLRAQIAHFAEVNGLRAQIAHFAEVNAALVAENGELRAQHADLVRARDAARADARMLRDSINCKNRMGW